MEVEADVEVVDVAVEVELVVGVELRVEVAEVAVEQEVAP